MKLKIKEPTLNIGQKQSSDEDKGDGVDDENEEVDDEVENVEEEVSEEWAETKTRSYSNLLIIIIFIEINI